MNFTEAIRKSNLAKEEVLKTREDISKTREIAEAIKAALIERNVEINDVEFENIAQYIKDNEIGAGTPWERPNEWLTLSKIIAEEGVYTKLLEDENNSFFNFNKIATLPEGVSYLEQFVSEFTNLSTVTTGEKNGIFRVSANDFAYEMLCKVKKDDDNLLLFEGSTYLPHDNIPFTQLSSFESTSFLTDLFIQIDNEEPLNLTKLAKGEIELPTEGKYKNIAIINNDSLTWEKTDESETDNNLNMILKNIYEVKNNYSFCNAISLLISLDYNCFDDNTKMKNGDKQCVIRIWGNGFIHLLPARTFSATSGILNNVFTPINVRINDCIIDVSVCDSNIDALMFLILFYYGDNCVTSNSSIDYMPLTLETLYLGFGDNNEKITFVSNLKSKEFIGYFSSLLSNQSLPGLNCVQDDDNLSFAAYNPYDFNFYMNLKQIDCSNINYYNSYANMLGFLLSTPIVLNRDIHSMTAKLKNVENIIFPNFKKDIQNKEYYILNKSCSVSTPYYLNLSSFKALTRESILDLIEKLPVIDLDLTLDNFESKIQDFAELFSFNFNNDGTQYSYISPVVHFVQDGSTVKQQIIKEFDISGCLNCFNGDTNLVEKILFRNLGYDTNELNSLNIRYNLDTEYLQDSNFDTMFIDKKFFHSILLSTSVFNKLTTEDIQLAKDKGWRIVKGMNHFMQTLYNTVEQGS